MTATVIHAPIVMTPFPSTAEHSRKAVPAGSGPGRLARRSLHVAVALSMATALANPHDLAPADGPRPLASAVVSAHGITGGTAYEGVVEAVRQTVVAAQVPGAVVALHVRAGERVHAGQVLLRLDARAADDTAAARAAQARAATAAMEAATREIERQRQLFAQGFISQAALDRADAQFKAAKAEASAQAATAGAARASADLHVVKAPYDGIVAQVSVVQGEMAMPGRPLLTLYDPTALRITAAIPQSAAVEQRAALAVRAEIPGATSAAIQLFHVQLLPTVDASSHTMELRLELPADTKAAPGMFARVWVSSAGAADDVRLFVPTQALVRRSELAAVYVLGVAGRPVLRQVRPGRPEGAEVEILSGVAAGERVALDPQAAARAR